MGYTIYNLRQDIDIHRMIGLNVDGLLEAGASKAFFGHLQNLTMRSISLGISKIFEPQRGKRFELYSVPAILDVLPDGIPEYHSFERFERFALNYGGCPTFESGREIIRSAYERVSDQYKAELKDLKTYRNKFVAHPEFGVMEAMLPSHKTFDELWGFARDFYVLVHDQYNGVGPALIGASVRAGLRRTFKQLGLRQVIETFPGERKETDSDKL